MAIEQEIEAIRLGIKAGKFPNEASVSQGIVLRLLNALGWPAYDTDAVWPEFALGGRRVDYALCSPPSKPIAFIEVKQIGQSDGAERQLFEYAYHKGVPMAILTDGREWNFFLPGEQGDYGERRVYKLDIVDRDVKECVQRLERYLLHSAITSGAAIQAVARKVIMSHFAQSKTEPLFRKVSLLCAKADDASEGSVDVHPCTQGPGRIFARDLATPGHFPQYRDPLPGLARRTPLQGA